MSTVKLSPATWYWLAWLLEFLIPEIYWVITHPAYTLSDSVWGIESLNLRDPFALGSWTHVHWTVAFTVWALFGWLSLHLPFGLLR